MAILLIVVLAAAVVVTTILYTSASRQASELGRELQGEKKHRGSLERETATLHRMAVRLHEEHEFLSHFLSEFPHLSRELHSGVSERRIPLILLNIVTRILEPKQALILVRRRRAHTDPAREGHLVVAAAEPEGVVKLGTEIPVGHGEIGFVGEVQRTMSSPDFDSQAAPTRIQLKEQSLPGFALEIAAPLVFGEETLGVIAVSKGRQDSPHCKGVLRLIAQVGALAIHDVTAYSQMKVTADIDGLTLVFNKRHMTQALGEEIFRSQQEMQSLSVFLFDIDNFKHYNDTNGHVAGDKLLQMLARLVHENTRSENIFGRFGGEEFLLIFRNTPSEKALRAAENIKALIAAHPFPFAERQPLGCLSVSGGVAEYPKDALDSNALLRAADAALYESKRQGRNRVLPAAVLYLSEPEDEPEGDAGPDVPK